MEADLAPNDFCLSVNEKYDYSDPFWQYAKYRWTESELSDYRDVPCPFANGPNPQPGRQVAMSRALSI
jgi:hypothetical protein